MSYKYMDEKELQIALIDNISSISSYNTIGSNNNDIICFNISYYDGKEQKSLRYFSDEKNYMMFVKKIYEYYIKHKDEFILDTPSLSFENKKRINNLALNYFNHIDNTLYLDKLTNIYGNSIKKSFSYFGDNTREIESLLPVLISELYKIFGFTKEEVIIDNNINIYNNSFVININRNGKNEFLPITFNHISDSEFNFSIGNLFSNGFISLNIKYSNEDISIEWKNNSHELSSYTKYDFKDNFIERKSEAYKKDKLISLTFDDINSISIPDNDDIDFYFNYIKEDKKDYLFFKINENEIYALKVNNTKENDINVNEKRSLRFVLFDNKYYVKDSNVVTLSSNKILIHVNEFTINQMIIKAKDKRLIESVFIDSDHSSGKYKDEFEGKVTYRLIKDDQIIELDNLNDLDIQRLYLGGK